MCRLFLVALTVSVLVVGPASAGNPELVVESAQIKKTKANGKAWDAANGPPDPYVIVFVQPAGEKKRKQIGKTAFQKDTYKPRWSAKMPAVKVGDVVTIEVWDKDAAQDDLIGRHTFTVAADHVKQDTLRLSFDQVEKLQLILRPAEDSAVKKADSPELPSDSRAALDKRPRLVAQLGHSEWIHAVAFSPDGTQVLTGGSDRTARLWDAQSGKQLRKFTGHTAGILSVAFSPDGTQVLTGGNDKTARLWDAGSGKIVHAFPEHDDKVCSVAFSLDGKQVLTGSFDKTARLWDAKSGKELRPFTGHANWIYSVAFSPDGKQVLTGGYDTTARLWDASTGKEIRQFIGKTFVHSVVFSPDGKYVLTGETTGAHLWETTTGKELAQLITFQDGTWAVVDTDGRYDAANGGDVQGLHWVVGNEPIDLAQLKERYYDPGLLAKKLGFNKEPLRQVEAFTNPKLFPEVQVAELTPDKHQLGITLTNRGGGIGRVVVKVNGKELTADARPRGADPNADTLHLDGDLAGDPRLKPGEDNVIEVEAFNAEGYLRSRGLRRVFKPVGTGQAASPELWAVVGGVSHYRGGAIDLRYAAKDAEDFAMALQVAAGRLFGADKVHLQLLTTTKKEESGQPTRENLVQALEATRKAKPTDILVIYLAGHGVNHGGQDGDFYFLTSEARGAELTDPEVRKQAALSSRELTELIKQIPALKQVMILDTCASGKALAKLTEKRDVPSSQIRALERVKDRTGLHILAGCAADAVSYEASRYAQGVLTYSLLLGMRGAKLRDGQFVDVVDLFGFASDKVPELARDIGGIQRPVIASPRGASFDIGRVTPEDQAKIPLQSVRPLMLRASFQEDEQFDDVLGLGKQVDEMLRSVSARGRDTRLVFVDTRELPDAYRLAGRYRIEDSKVTVTGNLFQGKKKAGQFSVSGEKAKVGELVAKIIGEMEKHLGTPVP